MAELTAERLKELLHYDAETGAFSWRVNRGAGAKAGARAGCVWCAGDGKPSYLQIRIDGHLYLGHRLAFFYMHGEWPTQRVDHRDCNGLNNSWSNLRPATNSENMANGRKRSTNTSGLKGVTYNRQKRKWAAQIKKDYRRIHLGYFDSKDSAHAAYLAKAETLFGEFARGE